jgi:uncharacterized protein (TIGR00106 family)
LNLIEVILAQGSTYRVLRLSFSCRYRDLRRLPTCHLLELHMANRSTFFLRLQHSLLALPLVLCGAGYAQQAQQQPSPAVVTPAPAHHTIAEIQVIPRPVGTASDRYKHVDAAIAVIQASGLKYEVHALGTVIEGPSEKIWTLLQAVHQATLEAGAERTLTIVKVSSGAGAGGPRVEDLVRKFRN